MLAVWILRGLSVLAALLLLVPFGANLLGWEIHGDLKLGDHYYSLWLEEGVSRVKISSEDEPLSMRVVDYYSDGVFNSEILHLVSVRQVPAISVWIDRENLSFLLVKQGNWVKFWEWSYSEGISLLIVFPDWLFGVASLGLALAAYTSKQGVLKREAKGDD